MKTLTKIALAASILVPLGGFAAYAEGPGWAYPPMENGMAGPHGPHEFGRLHGALAILGLAPGEHKGPITRDEIEKAAAEQYAKADTKHDGQVTLDEFITYWVATHHEMIVRDFQRIDSDGTGKITPEEWKKSADRLANIVEFMQSHEQGPRGMGMGEHHRHAAEATTPAASAPQGNAAAPAAQPAQ